MDDESDPGLKIRMAHACDVCGNWPDEDGILEHGKGCYVLDEDGGGSEHIELGPTATSQHEE